MVAAHRTLLLRSLHYDRADALDVEQDLPSVVAWLEHTKVRLYPVDARGSISDVRSAAWPSVFNQYLTDLECPLEHSDQSASRGETLDWLLRHAVSLEYADSHCASNAAGAPPGLHGRPEPAGAAERDQPLSSAFPDLDSPEARAAIARLLARLDLGPAAAGMAAALGRAAERIAERLRASAAGAAAGDAGCSDGAVGFDVRGYPLGFATGEAALDTAATVLRLLYLRDLRTLQTQIDETLVRVQEFTANPRTNAHLGRVGR
ncbi:hypothetical protein WJX81_004754 [Elliptochloris bilobata]|uniref:Uncharacterized protein n=1 Tax=Elliptochloris bilobata TaxID=381761 RepID=A0AAW1SF97_9CHLO